MQVPMNGSVRQNENEIRWMKNYFTNLGISLVLPDPTLPLNERLQQIKKSKFYFYYNKDSNIDEKTMFELGFALGWGLQILCLKPMEGNCVEGTGQCRLLQEVFPRCQAPIPG